jgi:hypothetical protein
MMNSGSLNPGTFYYGSAPYYLTLAVDTLAYFHCMSRGIVRSVDQFVEIGYGEQPYKGLVMSGPEILLWPRLVFAVIGALTILFVFLIAKSFNHPWAGVIGALALAISPLHAGYSGLANVDVLATFLVGFSVFSALLAYENGKYSSFLLSGALAGLAFGTKYSLLSAILPAILVAVLAPAVQKKRGRCLLLAIGGAIAAFLISNPFVLLDFNTFLQQAGYMAFAYGFEGNPGAEGNPGLSQLIYHLSFIASDRGLGLIMCILAVLGLFVILRQQPRKATILVAFPAFLLIYISEQKVNFTRNLLTIYPIIALLSGLGFLALVRGCRGFVRASLKRWPAFRFSSFLPAIVQAVVVISLCAGSVPVFQKVVSQVRTTVAYRNSQDLVMDWIHNHAKPGDKIAIAAEIPWNEKELARDSPFKFVRFSVAKTSMESLLQNQVAYIVSSYNWDYMLQPIVASRFNWQGYLQSTATLASFGSEPVRHDMVDHTLLCIARPPTRSEMGSLSSASKAEKGETPTALESKVPGPRPLRPKGEAANSANIQNAAFVDASNTFTDVNTFQYGGVPWPTDLAGRVPGRIALTGKSGAAMLILHDDSPVAANTGSEGLLFTGRINDTGLVHWDFASIAAFKENDVKGDKAAYLSIKVARGERLRVTSSGESIFSGNVTVNGSGMNTFAGDIKFAGKNLSGSGSASLGANSPATAPSSPYTWIRAVSSDGSTVWIPAWK